MILRPLERSWYFPCHFRPHVYHKSWGLGLNNKGDFACLLRVACCLLRVACCVLLGSPARRRSPTRIFHCVSIGSHPYERNRRSSVSLPSADISASTRKLSSASVLFEYTRCHCGRHVLMLDVYDRQKNILHRQLNVGRSPECLCHRCIFTWRTS